MARFRERLFVRYSEVDQQGVVFNAHYLTYGDTAVDQWLRSRGWHLEEDMGDWDFMVVKAVVEWQGSARYAEHLDVEVHAARWGTASFDVACEGRVGERPVFTATLTYVGVRHGTTETMPIPDAFKAAFAEAG